MRAPISATGHYFKPDFFNAIKRIAAVYSAPPTRPYRRLRHETPHPALFLASREACRAMLHCGNAPQERPPTLTMRRADHNLGATASGCRKGPGAHAHA
jgi:hypothetical protein